MELPKTQFKSIHHFVTVNIIKIKNIVLLIRFRVINKEFRVKNNYLNPTIGKIKNIKTFPSEI